MTDEASYHAVYFILNDRDFFAASLRSVYPHITGATVITRYDRDRWNRPVTTDGLVELILSRELDPERKVNVIVATDESEPRLRNRAMAFARIPSRAGRIVSLVRDPTRVEQPDYFWHVDADEVYDDADVERLKRYVDSHRARAYMLQLRTYFRTWNWQIEEPNTFVAITRPGFWFGTTRHWYPTFRSRATLKLERHRVLPTGLAYRSLGVRLVPPEVAVCHHGSYVGDRARIAAKLTASAEREEVVDGWLERVWDQWTPESRNFHPHRPELFPRADYVPTATLPRAIREHRWPRGWIEDA